MRSWGVEARVVTFMNNFTEEASPLRSSLRPPFTMLRQDIQRLWRLNMTPLESVRNMFCSMNSPSRPKESEPPCNLTRIIAYIPYIPWTSLNIDCMLVHISKCCRLVHSMFWFARTITSSMTRSQMLGATVVCDLWVWSLTSVAWRSLEFGPCLATSCPDAKCQGCQGSMFLVRLCQVGKFHTFKTCSCQFDGHDLTDLIRLDCSVFFNIYGWWF